MENSQIHPEEVREGFTEEVMSCMVGNKQGEEIPGRGYQCLKCVKNCGSAVCFDWQGEVGGEAGEGFGVGSVAHEHYNLPLRYALACDCRQLLEPQVGSAKLELWFVLTQHTSARHVKLIQQIFMECRLSHTMCCVFGDEQDRHRHQPQIAYRQ